MVTVEEEISPVGPKTRNAERVLYTRQSWRVKSARGHEATTIDTQTPVRDTCPSVSIELESNRDTRTVSQLGS